MADFERDYIMRVIRDMVRFVSTVVLGKAEPEVDTSSAAPSAVTYSRMLELVEQENINDAEDMLYEQLDTTDAAWLETGLAFYYGLTEMSDDSLEAMDYSREEILDGIHELCGQFGIDGLDQFR